MTKSIKNTYLMKATKPRPTVVEAFLGQFIRTPMLQGTVERKETNLMHIKREGDLNARKSTRYILNRALCE